MQIQSDLDNVLQLIGFTAGKEKFAIDISEVHEINRFEQINRIPDLPDHVLGVIDLRGIVIPVINLSEKLGIQGQDITKDTRIIIAGFNGEKIGILVDSVSEVIRVSEGNLEKPPSFIQNIKAEYICGIIRSSQQLIVVLDLQRLFSGYIPSVSRILSPVSRDEHKGPVQNPEQNCTMPMDKIVEVTKAMAGGDFHHEIGGELYGQIGEIAKHINATMKRLQTIEPNIAQASDKIPAASVQLSEITKVTEEATHGIMGQTERVLDSQDLIIHYLDIIARGEDIAAASEEIRQIVMENKETLLDIITGLSFQDLTGQKIKVIVSLIEEIEKRILNLIVTFGLKSKETVKDNISLREFTDVTKLEQGLVDNILQEFGFD